MHPQYIQVGSCLSLGRCITNAHDNISSERILTKALIEGLLWQSRILSMDADPVSYADQFMAVPLVIHSEYSVAINIR